MEIEYIEDRKPGDEIPAIIFGCVATDDTGFGTGLKWLLVQPDGRTFVMFTPDVTTKRNRLGRCQVRLQGELRPFDTEEWIGMTVTVQYISKKTDATQAVADLMVPRKPAKGEDVTALVGVAVEAEAVRDITGAF
jgi:hypothetical protein